MVDGPKVCGTTTESMEKLKKNIDVGGMLATCEAHFQNVMMACVGGPCECENRGIRA